MRKNIIEFTAALFFVATLALPGAPALAQDDGGKPSAAHVLELGGLRRVHPHQRSHPTVRRAFREVVDAANNSTVRIECDDKLAALGTIVDPSGYIITKASELTGDIVCKLADGRLYDAELVGAHHESDLALLKIDASDLPAIAWSESPSVVGSWVATPSQGELPAVGVVSVGERKPRQSRGVLGVLLGEKEDLEGARVEQIVPGSGAEKAGLEVDDVVVGVNGREIDSRDELIDFVNDFQPGDRLRLSVRRGDEKLELTAVLSNRASLLGGENVSRRDFQNSLGGDLSERRSGFPLVLQHDTVLHPSLCGGPLVDLDGRAVGINIARTGRTASFALPASLVIPLVDELKSSKLADGEFVEHRGEEALSE